MKHHSQAQNDLKIFNAIVNNKRFALHKKIHKYLKCCEGANTNPLN
jgi:hypothetical protein